MYTGGVYTGVSEYRWAHTICTFPHLVSCVCLQGAWYCEVAVVRLGGTGHVRVGWSSRKAELQAPAGFDVHGYSYRDVAGDKVHNGRRDPYG